MKILAVLQNQWFHDPERMRAILERGLARGGLRHDFTARTLFMGCRTGQILKSELGVEWCRKIVWAEASPEIGGRASSCFPADPIHLQAVLAEINPDVVLAFGRIASDALVALIPADKLIVGPHPTARGPDVPKRLREMRAALEALNEGLEG